MDTGITYRLANDDDFEQIYAIWLEGIASTFSGMHEPGDLKQEFKQHFDNRKEHFNFWVAEVKGVIEGWQSISHYTSNPIKRNLVGEASTYVKEKYRGHHIGKVLLSKAVDDIKNSPLHFIISFIHSDNHGSLSIYHHNLFFEISRLPAFNKEPFDKEKIILLYNIEK